MNHLIEDTADGSQSRRLTGGADFHRRRPASTRLPTNNCQNSIESQWMKIAAHLHKHVQTMRVDSSNNCRLARPSVRRSHGGGSSLLIICSSSSSAASCVVALEQNKRRRDAKQQKWPSVAVRRCRPTTQQNTSNCSTSSSVRHWSFMERIQQNLNHGNAVNANFIQISSNRVTQNSITRQVERLKFWKNSNLIFRWLPTHSPNFSSILRQLSELKIETAKIRTWDFCLNWNNLKVLKRILLKFTSTHSSLDVLSKVFCVGFDAVKCSATKGR